MHSQFTGNPAGRSCGNCPASSRRMIPGLAQFWARRGQMSVWGVVCLSPGAGGALFPGSAVCGLRDKSREVAEGERFELSEPLGSTVFKTVAFNRSATPPVRSPVSHCAPIPGLAVQRCPDGRCMSDPTGGSERYCSGFRWARSGLGFGGPGSGFRRTPCPVRCRAG